MSHYLHGCAVIIGAVENTTYGDYATVLAVQQKLKALGKPTMDPGKVDGVWGLHTAKAVRAYKIDQNNARLDGGIDDWVLTAFNIVKPGAQVVDTGKIDDAKRVVATAQTPADAKNAVVVLDNATKNASPEVQKKVEDLKKEADVAKTPADVEKVKEKAEEIADEAKAPRVNFFSREYSGVPVWGWGLAAAAIIGASAYMRSTAKVPA